MKVVRLFISLAASPVFFLLGALLFFGSPQGIAICGVGISLPGLGYLGQGPSATLGSMWLMYLLMGFFHCGPWLALLGAAGCEETRALCCDTP